MKAGTTCGKERLDSLASDWDLHLIVFEPFLCRLKPGRGKAFCGLSATAVRPVFDHANIFRNEE